MKHIDAICADTKFWRNQWGDTYLFKSEKEASLGLTKSTVGEIKKLWNMMKVPERVEWCVAAGIGGKKASIDVSQMDIDMIDSLSQVAIIIDKENTVVTNGKKNKVEELTEAVIGEPGETEAQETTPEANKAVAASLKPAKKTKQQKQEELGEQMTAEKPKTKPKVEKPKVTKPVSKKPEETETKPVSANAFAKAWADATNRAKYNMCTSVGVRKNHYRVDYADLSKEDKAKIVAGDISILTYKGKKGRTGNGEPKPGKPETEKVTTVDPNAKLTDIQLRNLRDVGDGKAFLAKGIGNNGRNYVVFVAERS